MKTNHQQQKLQKELEKEKKIKQRLKKFDHFIERSETNFSFSMKAKKKTNYGVKISKEDVLKPIKSLRSYIEQHWNKVLTILLFYIILFGAIVSTPIVINHFGVQNQNQTEKERFIVLIILSNETLIV